EQPGLLNELELAVDIRVEAHKQDAGLLALVLRLVGPPDAQETVPVGDGELQFRSWREGIARIGAANMGTERTAHAVRILGTEKEVIVGLPASGLARIAHQRAAVVLP